MELKDHQIKYFLQEEAQIREEILFNIQEIGNAERYALIVSGAVWTWLLTQQWMASFFIALWIPAVATWLLFQKREALSDAIKEKAAYLKKLEALFELKSPQGETLGWERREREKNFKNWSKVYWNLLFWGNMAVAVVYALTQYAGQIVGMFARIFP